MDDTIERSSWDLENTLGLTSVGSCFKSWGLHVQPNSSTPKDITTLVALRFVFTFILVVL